MNFEKYLSILKEVDHLKNDLKKLDDKAIEIGKYLYPQSYISVEEYWDDEVIIEISYRGNYDKERFPAKWLFDSDWKKRIEEKQSLDKQLKEQREKDKKLAIEKEERRILKILKEKYANG